MGKEYVTNWQSQLRKGLLDTVILNLVQQRRRHGYELAQLMKQIEGLQIREGNIYPILARLQAEGLLTAKQQDSPEGPPRKYYQITELGRRTMDAMNRHWDQMDESIQQIRSGGFRERAG